MKDKAKQLGGCGRGMLNKVSKTTKKNLERLPDKRRRRNGKKESGNEE